MFSINITEYIRGCIQKNFATTANGRVLCH